MTDRSDRNHADRYRLLALMALSVALVAQSGWIAWRLAMDDLVISLWRPLWFTVVFLLVAATRTGVRSINILGRLTIAGAFLLALWNRFDNFPGFVRYAGRVLSFVPVSSVPFFSVVATTCEVLLCVALFLGVAKRWTLAGAGLLLLTFASSMVVSGLSQFSWAVYVLATGAFAIAAADHAQRRVNVAAPHFRQTSHSPVTSRS